MDIRLDEVSDSSSLNDDIQKDITENDFFYNSSSLTANLTERQLGFIQPFLIYRPNKILQKCCHSS